MDLPEFIPAPIVDANGNPNSAEYGFVVNHHAYWGIPIPGFDGFAPTAPDSDSVKNMPLYVSAKLIDTGSKWTNGQIKVLATRMPPLFHALHHNTLVDAPKSFIPRNERGDLPEAGELALVGLCNLDFDSSGNGTANVIRDRVPMEEFYKVESGVSLIQKAQKWDYFEVEGASDGFWDVNKVGPLGALWIVLLNEDGTTAWFDAHLGGGYRMWHYLSGSANRNFFDWKFGQSPDKRKIEINVKIGVSPLGHTWKENIELRLDLAWD